MLTLTFALKDWPLIGQGLEWHTPREKTPATMSVQEASQRPTSPLPLKPEAKPRPEIPPKPSPQTSSPPLGDRGSSTSLSEGKVKRIVNKFSNKECAPSDPVEQPTNGTAEFTASKRLKRPPTIKPKPGRASLQLQTGREQAPPLPLKRRTLQKKKESEGGDGGDSISVEGGRSGTVVLILGFGRGLSCLDLLLFHFYFYILLLNIFFVYTDFMF